MTSPRQVAALFVREDSIYKTMPGVDAWDAARDALAWPGGYPVVAHPPCRAWGQLRRFAKPRPGEMDLAPWAVEQVRRWGGVLEHPAKSSLWPALGLPEPALRDSYGGWTMPLLQFDWGHRASKATRLYIVGIEPRDVPAVPLVLGVAPCVIGGSKRNKAGVRRQDRPEISKQDRERTPVDLAEWLVALARLTTTSMT